MAFRSADKSCGIAKLLDDDDDEVEFDVSNRDEEELLF